MTFYGVDEIGCPQVLASLIFIIEDATEEIERQDEIVGHITTCLQCAQELAHERFTQSFLIQSLRRSCQEKAPQGLYESIQNQLLAAFAGSGQSTEVVTTFSMTEISIEIDEFGNVEHHEVQIEQTQIQRIEFTDSSDGGEE